MKGIYLASYIAYHPNYDIDYQDINGNRDIAGDMMDVDLSKYDYIIATPPCNYWSRARGNRKPSQYALNTKNLLPDILHKLIKLDKPFIVENVRNFPKFNKYKLFDLPLHIYEIGRHTYWTNIMVNFNNIEQKFDFSYGGKKLVKNTQGGLNVHNVIEYWLKIIH